MKTYLIRGLILLPLFVAASFFLSKKPARPNVLLISIDGLRADRIESGVKEASPFLHDFAAGPRTTVFTKAYANAHVTLQSHMTMFTGLYPPRHGVQRILQSRQVDSVPDVLAPGIFTLSESFRQAGYFTFWAAYSGDYSLLPSIGFGRGVDHLHPVGFDNKSGAESILERFFALRGKKPFFAFLHTKRLHAPLVLPPPYDTMFTDPGYRGRIIGNAERFASRLENSAKTNRDFPAQFIFDPRVHYFWSLVDSKSPADLRQLQALYDGALRSVDDQLSQLFKALENNGALENTIVVITSDHGEAFHEHGFFMHTTLHEESIRVPLIVRVPSGISVPKSDSLAQTADILPTLFDLADIPQPPYTLNGRSLRPELSGKAGPQRRVYSFSFVPGGTVQKIAVREGNRKLIFSADGAHELYDLSDDPAEKLNLHTEKKDDLIDDILLRQSGAWL